MPVKEERDDEEEINELARKIAETNRQKLVQAQLYQNAQLTGPVALARPGQPGIAQFFNRATPQAAETGGGSPALATSSVMNGTAAAPAGAPQPPQPPPAAPPVAVNGSAAAPSPVNKAPSEAALPVSKDSKANVVDKPVDEESKKGRFGWFDIEKVYLPFIFRYTTEKYTSVRMVERKLLNRFLQVLPPEVNSCTCIRSYYITDSESKLLNEINLKHTDCSYGKEAFTSKDLVVRLKDAKEFHKFLDLCHKKLVLKKSNASDRCGFFRINGESVVPYTVKEGTKYVPLFYFEGETEHLKLKSEVVDGWDLAYLKFCCKVQGIRNELFANDVCKVVALEEIKGHFPSGTTFEDYWPAKGSIEPVASRHGVSAGNWTQKPAGQPKTQTHTQGNAAAAQLGALNMNPAYRNLAPQQLTAAQQQQLLLQQGLNPSQLNSPQFQQLLRAGLIGGQGGVANLQSAVNMAALMRPQAAQQSRQGSAQNKAFPGKLTQIKEFPIEKSNQQPYKLQKALIDQKIVPCINVRPYVFHDLMMSLPDFVKHFFPDLPLEKSREMLQEILKVVLYKGNTGHQEVLRTEGKCGVYDPVPLVLVKDIMTYMPQMKYMFSNMMAGAEPAGKRQRVA
jgi:hypothetical protein